jgi:hypothetical protein
MANHICVECLKLPESERPTRPRKTDVDKHPRTPRCRDHRNAIKNERSKAQHEKRVQATYGLAPGEYDEMYAAQGGKCWFSNCRATGKKKRLTVDHDHVTGRPRGLICHGHNYYLLGWYQNDLEEAIDYVKNPPYDRWKNGQPIR